MRRWTMRGVTRALTVFALTAVAGAPVAGQERQDSLAAQVDSLAARLRELELELARQQAELQAGLEAEMRAEEEAAVAGRSVAPDPRLRSVSGIGSRPFVWRGGGAAVGGYVDLEYQHTMDEEAGPKQFIAHRMIPFIFAEITDRIHFGTELEFEYGGEEIKVEFAALDVAFADALSFRGGLLLSPLGKFNLMHDSPVNDLTRRPLVDQQIIPTTLTEAGVGVFGAFYPSERSVLTYEAYITNGFTDAVVNNGGVLRPSPRIRSARGNLRNDNNDNKALVARLGFSPMLGLEVGASAHTGTYASRGAVSDETLFPYANDEGIAGVATFDGDERLTIAALDGIFTRGPFEVLGEVAMSKVDLPEGTGGELPESVDQLGYYAQGNFHFGHGLIGIFPSSVFTAVGRYDAIDFDTDAEGDSSNRLSVGLNWRPVEETVFKLSWERDEATARLADDAGDPVDAFWFSVASYF